MADKKISALTAATTPLAGTEVLPIVQSGSTVKVSVDNLTTGKPVSVGSLTDAGNLTFTGTGNRITGDFSNGTHSNRVLFQTSITNANTIVGFISNGTSTQTQLNIYNGSDATNASIAQVAATATDIRIGSGQVGAGAVLPMTFYVGGNKRLEVDLLGDVNVSTGNLVIGTSGKGIDFSATPGTGTSELLADYEEGTWTATISDGTTDATMNATRRVGTYTKVGRQVTVHNYVATTDMTGVTGNLRIKGLPFTVGSSTIPSGTIGFCDASMTLLLGQVMTLQTADGVDFIAIRYWNGASGTVSMPGTLWGTNGEIAFSLTYFV
jgi:hypothetical protein